MHLQLLSPLVLLRWEHKGIRAWNFLFSKIVNWVVMKMIFFHSSSWHQVLARVDKTTRVLISHLTLALPKRTGKLLCNHKHFVFQAGLKMLREENGISNSTWYDYVRWDALIDPTKCCNWRLKLSLTMNIFTVNIIPSEGDDFLRWWYHIFLALQSKHKDWLTVHATSWVEKTGKKEQETDYDKWRMIISWSRFSPSSTQLSRIKHSLLCSFSTQSIVEKYFLTAFLC